MIKKAHIKNFKAIDEATIEFTEKTIILGPNGIGKSSIFEAIGKGMFLYNSNKIQKMVKEGTDNAEISIWFDSQILQATVKTYLRFGKSSSIYIGQLLDDDGNIIQEVEGSEDLESFIRQHLGIADISLSVAWSQIVGVPQGELRAIFKEDKSRRIKAFQDLLNITKFENSYRKLSPIVTALKHKIDIIELKINSIPTMADKNSLEHEIRSKQYQINKLKLELESTKELLNDYNQRLSEHKEHIEKQKEIPELKLLVANYERLIDLILARDSAKSKLLKNLTSKLAKLRDTKVKLEAEVEELSEEQIHLSKNHNGFCVICGSELDISDINKKLVTTTDKIKSLKVRLQKLSVAIETFNKLYLKQNSVRSEIDYIEKTIDSLSISYDDNEPIETYLLSLQTYKNKLREIENFESLTPDFYNNRDELTAFVASTNTKILAIKSNLQKDEMRLNELNDKMLLAASYRTTLEELHEKLTRLTLIRNNIRDVAPIIAQETVSIVNAKAQDILGELTTKDFRIQWNDDFSISCISQGVTRDYDMLSGGESLLFALAIRLALTEVLLSNLRITLLDEPTDNLDVDSKAALVESLSNIQSRQLIIITHESVFENMASSTVLLS